MTDSVFQLQLFDFRTVRTVRWILLPFMSFSVVECKQFIFIHLGCVAVSVNRHHISSFLGGEMWKGRISSLVASFVLKRYNHISGKILDISISRITHLTISAVCQRLDLVFEILYWFFTLP